jgi:hypothetical protein
MKRIQKEFFQVQLLFHLQLALVVVVVLLIVFVLVLLQVQLLPLEHLQKL